MNQSEDLPPTNAEAEEMLCVSLIALPSAIEHPDVVAVQPRDIFSPQLSVIFRHLVGAHLDGHLPEVLPVRLAAAGEVEAAGGKELIRALFTKALHISGGNAAYFAGEVRKTAEARRLWEIKHELGEQIAANLPPADIRGYLASALDAMGESSSTPASRFEFLTSAQLADTDQNVPYIVDGVLAEGQPAVIGGPSKAMKTGTLADLLLSIQICGHFVGYFRVAKQKRCWLISGESGQNVIAETAARVAAAAQRDLRELDMLWGFKLPRLANAADVRELGRVIKGEGIGVLGVDPLYLSIDTDGKESSMFSMGSMLRPFSEVCVENSCTPVVAHHFRQTIRDFSPPQLQDLSHAGIEQFARQWILLKRREAYQAGTGEHHLHLVTGGSAGHGGSYHLDISEGTRETEGGRFWQTDITPATQAIANEAEQRAAAAAERERGRRVEHRQKIIEALRTFPKGETRRALRQATGLNDATFTTAMQELMAEGKAELCEVKKHTTTHDGYRLTTPQKSLCRDMVGHGESIPA